MRCGLKIESGMTMRCTAFNYTWPDDERGGENFIACRGKTDSPRRPDIITMRVAIHPALFIEPLTGEELSDRRLIIVRSLEHQIQVRKGSLFYSGAGWLTQLLVNQAALRYHADHSYRQGFKIVSFEPDVNLGLRIGDEDPDRPPQMHEETSSLPWRENAKNPDRPWDENETSIFSDSGKAGGLLEEDSGEGDVVDLFYLSRDDVVEGIEKKLFKLPDGLFTPEKSRSHAMGCNGVAFAQGATAFMFYFYPE